MVKLLTRVFYNCVIFLAMPIFLLLIKRQQKAPTSWRWRFGILHKNDFCKNPDIWFHCASLGEINAAKPIITRLIAENKSVLITCMTFTGFARAKELFPNNKVVLLPIDFYPFAKKFIQTLQPKKIVFFETEIWANFWWLAKSLKIELLVLNARISAKTFKSYLRFKFLFADVLACATQIIAISNEDAQRFIAIGISPDKVQVSGNVKLSAQVDENALAWAAKLVQGSNGQNFEVQNSKAQNFSVYAGNLATKKILLAASTHNLEEAILLEAFFQLQKTHKNLMLILVPRHTERFANVEKLLQSTNANYTKFSQNANLTQACDILLGDTMGDMHKFYALADFILVAGSLVDGIGGHNILEAGIYQKPLLSGKFVANFQEIATKMHLAQALHFVENALEIADLIDSFLQDEQLITTNAKNLQNFFASQINPLEIQTSYLLAD